jgi:hypothetical protein
MSASTSAAPASSSSLCVGPPSSLASSLLVSSPAPAPVPAPASAPAPAPAQAQAQADPSTILSTAANTPLRAQLQLASFPITGAGSSKLADFVTYLKSVRTIETSNTKHEDPQTGAAASAKRLNKEQSNNIESVAICVAKYLKFESSAESADQLDLLTELRDKVNPALLDSILSPLAPPPPFACACACACAWLSFVCRAS